MSRASGGRGAPRPVGGAGDRRDAGDSGERRSAGGAGDRPDTGGAAGSGSCDPHGHGGRCVVCRDEGRVGRVVELLDDRTARVRMDGAEEEVALDLVERVAPGADVLVHGGFAITRIVDGEARG